MIDGHIRDEKAATKKSPKEITETTVKFFRENGYPVTCTKTKGKEEYKITVGKKAKRSR
jgi:hypothetical protein